MRETALDPFTAQSQTETAEIDVIAAQALTEPQALAWDKMGGLMPVVVQDSDTLQVLMLGYMNHSALLETFRTGLLTFYSRSRQRLWTKGETTGHNLQLVELTPDCDNDCLLATVKPAGPVCHRHTTSCFGSQDAPGLGLLARLVQVIQHRQHTRPSDSYTVELMNAGTNRIAQKIGEEGVEVALAAVAQSANELNNEIADLIYHLLVMLCHKEIPFSDCLEIMRQRLQDYAHKG